MEIIAYSYIRFSTPEQLKGDSLRRQLQESKEYAEEKGWYLDESLDLNDLALSAFDGTHKRKGRLGKFLQLVKDDEIKKGTKATVLMVEEFDRLSREEIRIANRQFQDIIEAGIDIAITKEDKIYNQESLNDPMQLIFSILYMAQAHNESRIKSERLKSTWEEKRKTGPHRAIRHGRVSKKTPSWIELSEDGQKYKLNKPVCQAIEQIYKLRLEGNGTSKIEGLMNEDLNFWKRPPYQTKDGNEKSGGWRKSFINKLLYNNRELIGEYQPHKKVNGKRVPVGDPIPNYYPKAISEKLYYEVQEAINKNSKAPGNGGGGGKNDKGRNLFPYIARCGICGASMRYLNKGDGSKGGEYYKCDNSHRKVTDDKGNRICSAISIRYNEFVDLVFDNFKELDITRLFPDDDEVKNQIKDVDDKIIVINGKISDLESKIETRADHIANYASPETRQGYEMAQRRDITACNKLKEEKQELLLLKGSLEKDSKQLKQQINTVNAVREKLKNSQDEDEEVIIRLKLREALKRVIDYIYVNPLDNRQTYRLEDGTRKTVSLDNFIIRFRKSQVKYIQVVSLFDEGPEEVGPVYATTLKRKAKRQ
jgi:DNA invertase Pin-like site-specific DNA recombinase